MNTSTNTFESERRALRDLVFSLVREKNRALRKEYHIDAYKPETVGELKQLLKDGKVTIDPDYDKEDILDNPGFMEYTSLGTVLAINYQKPDKKAFREACTKLEKEQQRLLTQIAVLPPEEGLKRAESFEKTTIH